MNIVVRKCRRGITLIEILVCMSILISLSVGAYLVSSHIDNAKKVTECKSRMVTLMMKFHDYYYQRSILNDKLTELPGENSNTIIDPWGNPYKLKLGSDRKLISYGPNGKDDGGKTGDIVLHFNERKNEYYFGEEKPW